MMNYSKYLQGILFLVIIASDQYTKHLAYTYLQLGEHVEVIPGFVNFTLVYNPGAAFGLFADLPDGIRRVSLMVVSFLALFIVVKFLLKDAKDDSLAQLFLIAILSGAIGNIVDRVRFDSVVDFIDVYWQSYRWPAFNIADSAISIGVFCLLLRFICRQENIRSCNEAEK